MSLPREVIEQTSTMINTATPTAAPSRTDTVTSAAETVSNFTESCINFQLEQRFPWHCNNCIVFSLTWNRANYFSDHNVSCQEECDGDGHQKEGVGPSGLALKPGFVTEIFPPNSLCMTLSLLLCISVL